MEHNLENKDYFQIVLDFIRSSVHRNDVLNRLHDTLDIVFDRNFLPECAWKWLRRQVIQKIAMISHRHILRIFKAFGTTEFGMCTYKKVGDFFTKKKLKIGKICRATDKLVANTDSPSHSP